MAGDAEAEIAAMARLYAARWPDGEPSCPWCRSARVISIAARRKHRCANPSCRRDFSVLSGTPFASSKLSPAELLEILDAFAVHGAPSIHALALRLGRQYKTVYVIARKVIEVLQYNSGNDALSACLRSSKSTEYSGYWQRRAPHAGEAPA